MNYQYHRCPTCGVPIQISINTAHICDPEMIIGTCTIDNSQVVLTEEDIRRIVREELVKLGKSRK